MNPKAEKLKLHIQQYMDINQFLIQDFPDQQNATLFVSNIKIGKSIKKCIILIDDSQNILIQIHLIENIGKKVAREKLNKQLNKLNAKYPLFKFYQDAAGLVILEMTYAATNDFFEAKLIQNFLTWILDLLPKIDEKLRLVI